jgi:hypothetical protein
LIDIEYNIILILKYSLPPQIFIALYYKIKLNYDKYLRIERVPNSSLSAPGPIIDWAFPQPKDDWEWDQNMARQMELHSECESIIIIDILLLVVLPGRPAGILMWPKGNNYLSSLMMALIATLIK